VFTVHVPPLRERPGDCVVLAQELLRVQARRLGKPLTGIAPAAMDRLLAHAWPGNVRELANAIERAAILATGSTLGEADFGPLAAAVPPSTPGLPPPDDAPIPDERLESVERTHIVRVLERMAWVIEGKKGAAAVLGVAPSTLRSRMAQLGIRRGDRGRSQGPES
jgi:formate hydrogenlyase transcriptional activator